MNSYCGAALDYLSRAYDMDGARFSYMSTVGARGELINDFATPGWLRYTINTYLGLCEAERRYGSIDWLGAVAPSTERFIELHEEAITNCGDRGLLLVLLSSLGLEHPAGERSMREMAAATERSDAPARLDMQDLAWMLWGACTWHDVPRAQGIADRCFQMIKERFVDGRSGLPRHSVRAYRRNTVSFGSLTYFLRATHEYARVTGSAEARDMFARCLQGVLALQAEDGAWPWLIDVRTGVPIDLYPVFSVHQDSMAMLFLFPAQAMGIDGLDEVIARSLNWNYGDNEIGKPLLGARAGSAWFDRSVERAERWPRARRYLRGLGGPKPDSPPRTGNVRVNQECRSYHLGWVLFVWAGRALPPALEERDPWRAASRA